jgi:hypothetical protein
MGPNNWSSTFYDDPNLEQRFWHSSPNLDQDVIRRVNDILKDNPYTQTFINLGKVDDLAEYCMELNTDMRLNQRRYNLPISCEVAVVWVESNDLRKHFECSIILFGMHTAYIDQQVILSLHVNILDSRQSVLSFIGNPL